MNFELQQVIMLDMVKKHKNIILHPKEVQQDLQETFLTDFKLQIM